MLRQPIVVVLGQVDAGKTTLLDSIRSTRVQEKEAGAITQAIGASEVPTDIINTLCASALEKFKITISLPGLLFVDTPGHEAFANLRQRGGSLADIAVVVVDVAKGIEPQTIESFHILKKHKTPFIIAANKIDGIEGWKTGEDMRLFSEAEAQQRPDVQARLDERLYALVGSLFEHGFAAERFDRVTDFTKQVLIVPVSARGREGIPELLMFLAGLAQKYLSGRLETDEATEGKAKILEVREEQGLGKTIDAVLHQGSIREGDTIVFATAAGPITSKVKALLRPKKLDEMRDPREKFTRVQSITPAAGVRIACEHADDALAGSSLFVARSKERENEAIAEISAEIKEALFEGEQEGIIVRADALGSLEAIIELLADEHIPVRSAGIGSPSRKEVMEASSIGKQDKFLGAILNFNQPVDSETLSLAERSGVKIFDENVIYNLLEGYRRWVSDEKQREKREAFTSLVLPAKFVLLKDHCFRVSKPMVVGVEVTGGTLKSGTELLNHEGQKIGVLKQIQREKEAVDTARKGEQIAVSIEGPTFGRTVNYGDILYVDVPKEDQLALEGKYASALSDEDKELLKETKRLKGLRVF